MRLAAVALALLLAPSLAGAVGQEAPHILVQVENRGGAHELVLSLYEHGSEVASDERTVSMPAGETVELRIDVEVGDHFVGLARKAAATPGPWTPVDDLFGGGVAMGADMRGCDGATLVRFVTDGEAVGASASGCTARPARFDELLAEAFAAQDADGRRAIDVPLPREQDRGAYALRYGWDGVPRDAAELRFAWRGATAFEDGEGATRDGHLLLYVDPGASYAGASGMMGEIEASADDPVESLWFADGERTPTAWTRTSADFAPSAQADTSVEVLRETRYDEPSSSIPCAFRSPFQGTSWRPGDALADPSLCLAWRGATWRAGDLTEERGLRVVPFYATGEPRGGGVSVTRIAFTADVPYPVSYERYSQDAAGIVSAVRWTLEALTREGTELPDAGRAHAPPSPEVVPLDPLAGPTLAAARDRFPLALDEAAAAARADASLRAVQSVLARDDAALLGAAMITRRDDGSALATAEWFLVFGAEGASAARVVCARPAADPVPLALRGTLPPRCVETEEVPDYALDVGDPPAVGRAVVPTEGATFDGAVARWDLARGERAPVTHALVRMWTGAQGGYVEVGERVPLALTPGGAPAEASTDRVVMDLATGRTRALVRADQATVSLGDVAAPFVGSVSIGGPSGALGDSALPLVGGGVALGLLALLAFLLYSRLVRAKVLDADTRRAIHALVLAEPGLHASEIRRRLGKADGVGEYHLDVLVREGFLTAVATPGFRRYFVTGSMSAPRMRALAALRDGSNEKLYRLIQEHPGIQLTELAARAGVTAGHVSRRVERLREAGLVDKVQTGRTVALHALEA